MARKTKEPLFLYDILITGIASQGKAIAKVNDIVVFTSGCVPGDLVDLRVVKKKKNYMEARVVKFHSYSETRCEAPCEHFGICGGCKWQILPYEAQLKQKEQEVKDALVHLGKIELPEIFPILGSKKIYFYRNKLEFTFSNKRWMTFEELESGHTYDTQNAVGFHIPGKFDKVLDIDKCWLQDNSSNEVRNAIRTYALEHHLEFFDLREQHGFLRTLMIRTTSTNELMVVVVFFHEDVEKREALLNYLDETFPEITSLQYIINEKRNDSITDQEILTYKGQDAIYEKMEDLTFKIGPKSFYQTNSEQAYELYKVTRNFAALTGNELVYDLYTGTGTIANFVSKQAKKVVGIEYVPEAIEDAKINSKLNHISNTVFYAGDMKDILNEDFIEANGKPDVMIIDPPRAGMHGDVINVILEAAPERIVYVSCNPATQARDLALLDPKYKVTAIQPVDMFPHTYHVENVVQLQKRHA